MPDAAPLVQSLLEPISLDAQAGPVRTTGFSEADPKQDFIVEYVNGICPGGGYKRTLETMDLADLANLLAIDGDAEDLEDLLIYQDGRDCTVSACGLAATYLVRKCYWATLLHASWLMKRLTPAMRDSIDAAYSKYCVQAESWDRHIRNIPWK